jgi:hypothetical protein
MSDFTDIRTEPLKPRNPSRLPMLKNMTKYIATATDVSDIIPRRISKKEVSNRLFMSKTPTLTEPFIPTKEKQVSIMRRMSTLPTLRMPTLRMPTFIPKLTASTMNLKKMITNNDDKYDVIRKGSAISNKHHKKMAEIDKKIKAINDSSNISEDDKAGFIQILEDYKEILQYRRKYKSLGEVDDKTRMTYNYELKNSIDEISTKYAILYNLDFQIVECEKLLKDLKANLKDLNAKLEDLKAKLEVLKELESTYHYKEEFIRRRRSISDKDGYLINFVLQRADVCIEKLKEGKDLKNYIPIFKYGDYQKVINYLGREGAMPLTFLNTEELLVLFPELVEMSKSTSSLSDLITLLVELNTILEILKKRGKYSLVFEQQFKTLIDTSFIPLYNDKQSAHIGYCLSHFLTVEDFKRVIYTVDNLQKMRLNDSLLKDLLTYEIFTVSDLITLLDKKVLNVKASDLKLVFKDYNVLTVKEILALLRKNESAYYSDFDGKFKKLFENILTIEDLIKLSNREILTVEDLSKLDKKYDDSISDEEILEGLKVKLTANELLKVKITKYVLTTLLKYKILPIEVLKEFYILGFGKIIYLYNRIAEEEFEEFLKHKVLTVEDLQDFSILVKELKKLLTQNTLNDEDFEPFYKLLKHTDKEMLKQSLIKLKDNNELTKLLDSNLKMLKNMLENEGKKASSSGGRKAKAKANANAKNVVKPSPVKKVVCGKLRCIYKIHGSRKEHLKYNGRLITVAEYKKLMKTKTKVKA